MHHEARAERDGVIDLVHQTADGLGRLVGQHMKLARLELAVDMKAMSRSAGLIGVLAAVILVGYTLAVAGLAVIIGGQAAVGLPLLVIGLGHVAASGAGMRLASAHLRRAHLMNASADEAGRSLTALGVATEQTRLIPRGQEKAAVR